MHKLFRLPILLPLLMIAPGIPPAEAQNIFAPLGNAIRELTDPKPTPPARVSKPRAPAPAVEEEAPVPQTRPATADQPEAEPVEPDAAKPDVPPPVERPADAVPEAPAPAKGVEVMVNKAPEAKPEAATPPEPLRIYQTACPALTMGAVEGEILPPIGEGQCSAQSPLSITAVSVNGRMVKVSGEVITDCAVATMLPGWASDVDGYLWAKDNTRIETINIGTTYMCRNRVGGSEAATLSEHGFADAVDVVGFTLADGRTIDVASGWPGTPEQGSGVFRYAHDAACSRFMTTLGPEANAEHDDHLHLDMGCHGKTCTARMCE